MLIAAVIVLQISPEICFAESHVKGAVIRAHLAADPVSLDPAHADDEYSLKVLSNVMEGLMGYDGFGKLQYKLATAVRISNSGMRYTFVLRPKAVWSDGKPITAHDFVVGLRRTLDPNTGAKLADLFFSIRGAKAFNSGKSRGEDLGLSESGKNLVIDLEKPATFFLHALTQPQASPIRDDILKVNQGKWPLTGPATGPYRVTSYTHSQELRLDPNTRYWDTKANLCPILFQIVGEETTALRLFESGSLDFLSRVPLLEIPMLKSKGLIKEFSRVSTYFLAFNTKKPPFDDPEFRRAVAGVVDRKGILTALGLNFQPASSWLPPGLAGNLPFKESAERFSQAMKAVREKVARVPVSFTASFNSDDINRIVMEKMQQDIKKKLGIDVSLNNMDWATYAGIVRTNTPQMYRYNRGAPFMDPIWHLASFMGNDANNTTGWKDEEYDRLVSEVSTMPNGALRLSKIKKAQSILVDRDAVVIPVFFRRDVYLVSPKLSGFRVNPVGVTLFSEVSKIEK